MMRGRLLVVVALITVSSAIAIAACGGDDAAVGSNGTDSGSSDDATVQDTGAVDSGGSGNDSSVIDSAAPNACIGLDAGCFACCAAEDPDAATALAGAAISCACTTPGDCQDDCKDTLCKKNPKAPDAKCLKCLAAPDAGGCIEAAKASACGSDMVCQGLVDCFTQCKN